MGAAGTRRRRSGDRIAYFGNGLRECITTDLSGMGRVERMCVPRGIRFELAAASPRGM